MDIRVLTKKDLEDLEWKLRCITESTKDWAEVIRQANEMLSVERLPNLGVGLMSVEGKVGFCVTIVAPIFLEVTVSREKFDSMISA